MKEFMYEKTKEIFGYELISMEPLLGGAQKHTYLAKCSNSLCFVIYEWDKDKTFFKYDDSTAIFRSSSAALFEKNNKLMKGKGVLTPKLLFIDRSRVEQPYEYAFVEYIDGKDMDYIISKEPERLPYVMESLKNNINILHGIKKSVVGQEDRFQSNDFDLIGFKLKGIHESCNYLKENDKEYAYLYSLVEDKAKAISKELVRREKYTFIHGELGPNHVIVDKANNAYLIDIEGAKYCDVEEENSFIKLRFDNLLTDINEVVDDNRMLFYHIAHCFGNLKGAIELKQKGYYDMDDLNAMISFFHNEFEILR